MRFSKVSLVVAAAGVALALGHAGGAVAAVHARAATDDDRPRVLLVVSGAGRDGGRTRPGFEMDELSQAWNALRDNGLTLGIASPQGGAVVADRHDPEDPDNVRFLADARAKQALADTLAIAAVDSAEWDAVFVIGGKGAMFDLARDERVGELLGRIHADGGVVAAVCHGSAALATARDASGRPLVAGRRVTGFSNEEERQFAKRWRDHYPFLIEDELGKQGARWSEAPLMLPYVVVDGRLVTGQNPYSTAAVADALVAQLGILPRDRPMRRDERSLMLLERAYAGEVGAAARALRLSPEAYHVGLIGVVGHYQRLAAQTDADLRRALIAMRLAEPYMANEPMLQVSLADAEWRLGDKVQARQRLQAVLQSHPELTEAADLRRTWSE
jgi:putative intracellular protease/amidase